jgi:hypothetical protein
MDAILEDHLAFWRRAAVSHPLVSVSRWSDRSVEDFDWGFPRAEGYLEPDMLSVDRLLERYDELYRVAGAYDGRLLWTAAPPRAIPWMEAILGCPVRYMLPAGGFWVEPADVDLRQLMVPGALDANPWLRKLDEITEGIGSLAAGRFPVAIPLLRGPWDLASALRGPMRLFMETVEAPEVAADLATACARVWVLVNEWLAGRLPRWQGGYVGYYGLWAPDFAATTQNDCSVAISPAMYGDLMLAADRATIEPWAHGLFHLHSGGLHVLEPVLGLLHGQALNITVDPSGPSLDALLPVFRRIQEGGIPLHVLVFSPDDARRLQASLSTSGLAILCWPDRPS